MRRTRGAGTTDGDHVKWYKRDEYKGARPGIVPSDILHFGAALAGMSASTRLAPFPFTVALSRFSNYWTNAVYSIVKSEERYVLNKECQL